ncbi:inhibitor of nuclear factor kappa-B kinase subunit alpha-like [Ruditapes philippinarum]|uniref:inhibitor of nuclear factor kappa-B kinase subunit alpha-like n=1 Tax=Ruditapes philippinarum TaxID=129788 RepID=UPI00295B07D9|nr:inhibitor of nuclear factor kappa-B kinase subunit alpha-like [Ruditapes philippinarum]
MSQVIKKGPWSEERMLGSGGFGAVTLWKNEETDEKIALKRCRLQNEMTEKHKQRWILEIQIMQKLQHENVISAMDVPTILDVMPNELPLLAMEYCSGGDLRRILNQPQNCCGLKEFAIRSLIHDVSAGLEYLHGKKIIHRDLKPENIVLNTVEERVVYKIIDLGYAKELDQGSVCTSFVGTLQYLAPELFASQKYTCTVDYWSFGTVVFECITGYRPFLPNSPPVQWHKEVCKKSPEDICAKIDDHGEVKFYKTVPTTNRLSRSMQTYLEQWLRNMLRWDPKARGGGLVKAGRPAVFQMLDNILQMKIIYILNVASNELLTYPVIDQHDMSDLHKRIEEETKIPVPEQDIILANGVTPEKEKPASQCWLEPTEEGSYVYLFQHGSRDFEAGLTKNKLLPAAVQTIVKEPQAMIPFNDQKKCWAESVFYCEDQYLEFKRIVLSQRAAILSLIRIDSIFVKAKNKMTYEVDQMKTKCKFFLESLEHDKMFYNEQASNGGVSSDAMFSKWLKMQKEVQTFLQIEERVSELESQAVALQTKIVELQKSPFARTKQDDTLEILSKQARSVYQEFRQTARENRDAVKDQKPMVTVVVKVVLWRDKKLPDLYAHIGKIGACKADVHMLLPQVEECIQHIQANSKKLLEYQKQRQTAIWKLLEITVQQVKKSQPDSPQGPTDSMDVSRMVAPPVLPSPELSTSTHSNMSTPSMLQSIMSMSASVESLKALDDCRATSKMFEETLGNLLDEQESFTTMISDLQVSTTASSVNT